MKRSGKKLAVIIFTGIMVLTGRLWAQSAEDIVRELDKKQKFSSFYIEGSMTTKDRFGEKTSTYKAWSRGSRDFLIEFTNVEELGQKILRNGDDELYLYYPDAEDIIPIDGAAMKQSMFGDVSYEDLTEGKNTLDKYKVKLLETTEVDGVKAWRIEMNAISRKVPYPKQIVTVRSTDYIPVNAEYYARSGKLIKIMEVKDVRRFDDGRFMITSMELADKLRGNSSTRVNMTNVELNPKVDDKLFSLQSLY